MTGCARFPDVAYNKVAKSPPCRRLEGTWGFADGLSRVCIHDHFAVITSLIGKMLILEFERG